MPWVDPEFAQRVRHAREVRGLTKVALAARSTLHVNQVSAFEHGRGFPNYANLRRLCAALEVSADYLAGLAPELTGATPGAVEGLLMAMTSEERTLVEAFAIMVLGMRKHG